METGLISCDDHRETRCTVSRFLAVSRLSSPFTFVCATKQERRGDVDVGAKLKVRERDPCNNFRSTFRTRTR